MVGRQGGGFLATERMAVLLNLGNQFISMLDSMVQDGLMGTSKLTKERFYADCTPEDQEHYMKELKPHSYK